MRRNDATFLYPPGSEIMPFKLSSTGWSLAAGATSAALLIGAFALGAGQGNAPSAVAGTVVSRGSTPAVGAGAARITVTGTGSVSGTPNQLQLSMGVQTSGSTVSAALQSANQAVRSVTQALGRSGVRAPDIQTSGLSIQPNYGNSSPAPVSYGVSESINVTLRHLPSAGTQINDAVRAGGNATVVDGVSLDLTDTSTLLASARAKAVADAKTKAGQYARALGMTLGPVVSVSESQPSEPFPVFGQAYAAGAKSVPVPVHPGSRQLSVTVTAVFALG
jgi:uncharacterized protein